MSSDSPRVSVIMNCLNGERYLTEALDSVYSQTFSSWEIIFWDNASTDDTHNIVGRYEEGLRYFRSSRTTSLGEARCSAVEQARGEYLAFLDCDDAWLPDKLQLQVDIYDEGDSDLGIVYGRCQVFHENKKRPSFYVPSPEKKMPEGFVFPDLCKENFIPFVSAMVDKEKFDECGGFPIDALHSTDYFSFLQIARKYKVRAIDEVICRYREHDGNLTKDLDITGALESINFVSSFLPDKEARVGIKHQRLNLGIAYLRGRRYLDFLSVILMHNLWFVTIGRIVRKLRRFMKSRN